MGDPEVAIVEECVAKCHAVCNICKRYDVSRYNTLNEISSITTSSMRSTYMIGTYQLAYITMTVSSVRGTYMISTYQLSRVCYIVRKKIL